MLSEAICVASEKKQHLFLKNNIYFLEQQKVLHVPESINLFR